VVLANVTGGKKWGSVLITSLQQSAGSLNRAWEAKSIDNKWIIYSQRFLTRMGELAKGDFSGRHVLFEMMTAIEDPLVLLGFPGGQCPQPLQRYPQRHLYQRDASNNTYTFTIAPLMDSSSPSSQQHQLPTTSTPAGATRAAATHGTVVIDASELELDVGAGTMEEVMPPPTKEEEEGEGGEGGGSGGGGGQAPSFSEDQQPQPQQAHHHHHHQPIHEIEVEDLYRLEAEQVWPEEGEGDYRTMYMEVALPLRIQLTRHENHLRRLRHLPPDTLQRLVNDSEGRFADDTLMILRADELADELMEITQELSPQQCQSSFITVHDLIAALGTWEERVEDGIKAFETALKAVAKKEKKSMMRRRATVDGHEGENGGGSSGGHPHGPSTTAAVKHHHGNMGNGGRRGKGKRGRRKHR